MSTVDKLIKKIFSSKQISYKEAEKILLYLGFELYVSGSHHVFRKKDYAYNVSIKRRTKLLPYQIKMLREVLTNYGYKKN